MKNNRLNTRKLRYVFYILLTCVLCVECNEMETNTNNKNIEKMETNTNTALGYTKEPLKFKPSGNAIAIGYEPIVEIKLEPSQLAFIDKCKKDGKIGCTLTINYQQTYVSFYHFEPSVGNAR